MKNWFFHQERGRTMGPIEIEEMKKRIREGRIRLFDLIYREGESGWRMAMEHPDLRPEFKMASRESLKDRPWVVLQKKSDSSFEFGTSGPFSAEEVREALQAGRMSYSDYAWRDGFSEWKRIGTLEDFNRRLQRRAEEAKAAPPPLPEIPVTAHLQNVVEMKRPAAVQPVPKPPEAVSEDLTKPKPQQAAEPPQPPKVTSGRKEKPAAMEYEPPTMVTQIQTKTVAEDTATNIEINPPKKPRRKKTSAWVDWGVVAVLAIVLCAVVLVLSKHMVVPQSEPDSLPPSVAEPAVEAPPPTQVAKPDVPSVQPDDNANDDEGLTEVKPPAAEKPKVEEKTKVADKPKPAEKPKIADNPPTELILNVQPVSGAVKIEIRTDAGESYPVYIQIVGAPGQLADGPSFYKFMKFTPKGDRSKPLDLSGLKLPQGKFILRASTGQLKKEARMSVGTGEAQFKQNVARQRKMHAGAIWRERLQLYAQAQLLEKQISEAMTGNKKVAARGLEAIDRVKRSNGGNYILYDQWAELKDILTAARAAPSAPLLARAKQVREKAGTFSVWK